MWSNPLVQQNILRIRNIGFELIGPEVGRLACGKDAIGRMSEPQSILDAIETIVSKINLKKK